MQILSRDPFNLCYGSQLYRVQSSSTLIRLLVLKSRHLYGLLGTNRGALSRGVMGNFDTLQAQILTREVHLLLSWSNVTIRSVPRSDWRLQDIDCTDKQ